MAWPGGSAAAWVGHAPDGARTSAPDLGTADRRELRVCDAGRGRRLSCAAWPATGAGDGRGRSVSWSRGGSEAAGSVCQRALVARDRVAVPAGRPGTGLAPGRFGRDSHARDVWRRVDGVQLRALRFAV